MAGDLAQGPLKAATPPRGTRAGEKRQPQRSFRARYESYGKAELAATKLGWKKDGSAGEVADFVEFSDHRNVQWFATLEAAVDWLKAEVIARRTLFGVGDVDEFETVERRDRCRYCVCDGLRLVTHRTVTDDGIEAEEPASDDCHN